MQRDYKAIALNDLRAYPARKAALQNLKDKIAIAQTSTRRTEVLWMNFEPEAQISMKEAMRSC